MIGEDGSMTLVHLYEISNSNLERQLARLRTYRHSVQRKIA